MTKKVLEISEDEQRMLVYAVKMVREFMNPGFFGFPNNDANNQLRNNFTQLQVRIESASTSRDNICTLCLGAKRLCTVSAAGKMIAFIDCERCHGTGEALYQPKTSGKCSTFGCINPAAVNIKWFQKGSTPKIMKMCQEDWDRLKAYPDQYSFHSLI